MAGCPPTCPMCVCVRRGVIEVCVTPLDELSRPLSPFQPPLAPPSPTHTHTLPTPTPSPHPHPPHTHPLPTPTQSMLERAGVKTMLNELSSTVVFERPLEEGFVRKWQLACEGDIAHVVVMPNITLPKLERFVAELIESRCVCVRAKVVGCSVVVGGGRLTVRALRQAKHEPRAAPRLLTPPPTDPPTPGRARTALAAAMKVAEDVRAEGAGDEE